MNGMARTTRAVAALAAAMLPLSIPAHAAGQAGDETSAVPVRAVAFRADPMSPEFGRAFDLHVTLRVAPGTMLLLPDTLVPGEASQSAGAVSWTTGMAPGDSMDVVATYPVMGLANGEVELPTLEAATTPAAGTDAAVSPLTGPGADGVEEVVGRPFALRIGRVQVIPHRTLGDVEGPPVVRPPADVSGANWSIWAIGAAAIAVGLGVLVVLLAAGWWSRISERRLATALGRLPRRDALAALDRLLGRGWHRAGRLEPFYQEASEIFRGFAATAQSGWSEDLTSTELVNEIAAREGVGVPDDLHPAVISGEGVRFGTDRPDAVSAEAHVGALARWIANTHSAPSDPVPDEPGPRTVGGETSGDMPSDGDGKR